MWGNNPGKMRTINISEDWRTEFFLNIVKINSFFLFSFVLIWRLLKKWFIIDQFAQKWSVRKFQLLWLQNCHNFLLFKTQMVLSTAAVRKIYMGTQIIAVSWRMSSKKQNALFALKISAMVQHNSLSNFGCSLQLW